MRGVWTGGEGNMNIKVEQEQLVLFSPGVTLVDKLKMANAINDSLSGLFDGDPVILPLPEDAPSEFPRIQLRSKDERYSLSIAKGRLDFIFRYLKDEEKTLFPVPDLFEKFLVIFRYFKENIHTQFTRCAIVTNWLIELRESPGAEYLLLKYIRSEVPISKPYELELHYLIKDLIAGFEVNRWTRIKSARKISEPKLNKFVVFHIDINTLAEKMYEFDKDSLQRFLKASSKAINETIQLHFKEWKE